ncbi:MAG: alpha/beta fold hydrolase [Burkholderiales bacterium]
MESVLKRLSVALVRRTNSGPARVPQAVSAHGGTSSVRTGKKYGAPRLNHFMSLGPQGFHRIAYTEWGNPANPNIVLCVHGLTRNSRDFDALATDLSRDFRVVCMDVAGRGASDWLKDKRDYGFSLYQADAAALLARVTAPADLSSDSRRRNDAGPAPMHQVDWIGTSMGGLIGMMLAAKANSPIRRLVMNDVGPFIPWYALLAMSAHDYGQHTRFAGLTEVEQYLRQACASFGPLPGEHWRHLAEHNARRNEDGSYTLAFDPAVLTPRRDPTMEFRLGSDLRQGLNMWPVWDKVQCPALVLRGAQSNVLEHTTCEEMRKRHPATQVVEFPGVGHAPWLASEDQMRIVRDFLLMPISSFPNQLHSRSHS